MHPHRSAPPTAVLVHGAFADTSIWAEVGRLLRSAGLAVRTPAVPLRGLAQDAAHVRAVVRDLDGPVVLVGHDYSGAVISQASVGTDHIVALCYVAGFGLDDGECVLDVMDRFAPAPVAAAGFTAAASAFGELRLDDEEFARLYAAGLPPGQVAALSAAQRPIARAALTDRSGPPAWAAQPCWYAVTGADRIVHPTAQRFMAQRMAATEHLVDASHAVARSHPSAVAAMIQEAAGQRE
ncbi:alpha/beta fold hydrolase [Streptomyces sp. NPDC050400]|uniref:alpha/beta fold hydrolase n=1 Tax=Streptomyces sp. NPDC050400 TaxID=3365610 RepID=UPI0037B2EF89